VSVRADLSGSVAAPIHKLLAPTGVHEHVSVRADLSGSVAAPIHKLLAPTGVHEHVSVRADLSGRDSLRSPYKLPHLRRR